MIAAKLKLFHGPTDVTDPQRPELWTVRQAFDATTLPRLLRLQRSPGTIDKWRKAIWYWELVRPDDPPCGAVTGADLDRFPELLLAGRRLAITTHTAANQQLMYVQAIMQGAGLSTVPIGHPLPRQAATRHRRTISDVTLSAMYRACGSATCARDPRIAPSLLWRSILVLFFNCGCRRNEGLLMPRAAWRTDPDFPDLPGFDVAARCPGGWLVFHTPKTRSRKGGLPLVLPVSDCLARHLRQLDLAAPRRERLFPVGEHPSTWRKQLLKIQRAAGIVEPFTWQDLRKTCNRAYRRAAGRDVARFMLGHQPRGVNETWYDDLTEDAVAAAATLAQPAAFLGY